MKESGARVFLLWLMADRGDVASPPWTRRTVLPVAAHPRHAADSENAEAQVRPEPYTPTRYDAENFGEAYSPSRRCMDADTFYYTLDGVEYGPYKRERLQKWVNAGHFDERGACSVRSVLTGVVYDLTDILDTFSEWSRVMGAPLRAKARTTGAQDNAQPAPNHTTSRATVPLRRPSTAPPGCALNPREAAAATSIATPYSYYTAEYTKPAPPPGTALSRHTPLPLSPASAIRGEAGSASDSLRDAHALIASLDVSYGDVDAASGGSGTAGGGVDGTPLARSTRAAHALASPSRPTHTTAGNVRVNRHGSINIFSGVRFGDLQAELAALRRSSPAPPAATLTPMPSAINPRVFADAAAQTARGGIPRTAYDLPTLVFASLDGDVPALDEGAILTESQKLDPSLRPGLVFHSSADDAAARRPRSNESRADAAVLTVLMTPQLPARATATRMPRPSGAADDHVAATPVVPRPTAYAYDWSKMRAIFEHADRSGDGEISVKELMLALRHDEQLAALLHLPAHIHQEDGTRAAFERVFAVFDEDASRSIGWDEFLAHIMDWADWSDDDDEEREEEEEEGRSDAGADRTSLYHREIAAELPLPPIDSEDEEDAAAPRGLLVSPPARASDRAEPGDPGTPPGTPPVKPSRDRVIPRVSINRHGSISITVDVPRRSASTLVSASRLPTFQVNPSRNFDHSFP